MMQLVSEKMTSLDVQCHSDGRFFGLEPGGFQYLGGIGQVSVGRHDG
jgi:hypothetical protein